MYFSNKKSADAAKISADSAKLSAETAKQQLLRFEESDIARLEVTINPAVKDGAITVLPAKVDKSSDSIFADWTVKVTNLGPTIARGLNLSVNWYNYANTGGNFSPEVIKRLSTISPQPSPFGKGLKVGDDMSFPLTGQMPGWKDVVSSKDSIIIVMQVSYVDIFDQPQGTPDCVYYSSGYNGFIQCPFLIREVPPSPSGDGKAPH